MLKFVSDPRADFDLLLHHLIVVVLNKEFQGSINAWKMSKYGSFSGTYFPVFELNTDIHSVNFRISPNAGKYGPEDLRIWTLFTQCIKHHIYIRFFKLEIFIHLKSDLNCEFKRLKIRVKIFICCLFWLKMVSSSASFFCIYSLVLFFLLLLLHLLFILYYVFIYLLNYFLALYFSYLLSSLLNKQLW